MDVLVRLCILMCLQMQALSAPTLQICKFVLFKHMMQEAVMSLTNCSSSMC